MLDQLQENKRAKDESVQEIISELKSLQQQDNRRLLKVKLNCVFFASFLLILQEKEANEKLKSEVTFLKDEISSLKSSHHLYSQKMKLLVANMEKELQRETENRRDEVCKNDKLKLEIDEEQISVKNLKDQIEILSSKLKHQKAKSNEEYQKNLILSEALEEEKIKMEECQRHFSKENSLKSDNVQLNQKIQELESDLSILISQVNISVIYSCK